MNRVKFCEQGRYCQVFCVLCIAVLFALPTGALAQTGLFFSDFAHTYIGSVGVDGTGIQNLFGPNDLGTPLNQPNDIAIDSDAGFIFFASGTTSGVIGVASLDGSGTPSTLVSGVSSPRSLVVDSTNQRLYWIDSDINNNSEGIVKRCSSASGNGCEASTETVFSGINSANHTSIALDVAGDRIFISDNSGAQRIIQSASMAGGLPLSASDFTTIVSQANVNIRGMHYDARFDRIHWCQNSGLLGIFQRAADGSGNITSTVTSTNLGQSCDDIVIDSENSIAFWTGLDDSSDPAIQSINLDGSNRTIPVSYTHLRAHET